MVKWMYNREKERQNGHNKSEKRHVARGRTSIIFRRRGENIVFGPKYMTPDMSRKKSANADPMAGVSYISK